MEKTEKITIRLAAADKAAIGKAAQADGRTISGWLLKLARDAIAKGKSK